MCSSGASVNVWTFFNSCVWVPQLSSVWKMDLKIIQSLLERVQICKNAGKLQNLQNVEDLSEEQCSVQLFRTNKGLMNNQHKTKEQSWIIQPHTVLRTKGSQTFEGGYLNNFSYFFVLWTICKHILVKYLTQDSTQIKITCILYDLSYFVKIFHFHRF